MTNNPLAAALSYQKQGWAVIPLKRDKKPLLTEWRTYQSRLPTSQEITNWWQKRPDANVGVITGAISKIIVLDIDGPEGEKTLKDHKLNIPPTATSRTGGGGLHFLFKRPGYECRNF